LQCKSECPLTPQKRTFAATPPRAINGHPIHARLTFALSGALLRQVMLGHARGKQDDANH
jgi:hypothetical protein